MFKQKLFKNSKNNATKLKTLKYSYMNIHDNKKREDLN